MNRRHRPIKAKQGVTFRKFIRQLEDLGYQVEYRELVAADYGAPTMRKRFFLIARCDGRPIIWPEPTHGPADSLGVAEGRLQPYVGAYTQLDFSLPCPSIFDTAEEIKEKYGIRAQRPLAPKTMERIARGLKKFVLENPEPFIIQCNHGGERKPQDIREPMPTITGKHGYGVVEPYIVPIGYGEREGQQPRIHDIEDPLPTIVSSGKHYLCEPYIVQCKYDNEPKNVKKPLGTITTVGSHLLIEPYMVQIGQTGFTADRSKDVREPLTTIVSKNEPCLISPTLIQYHSETAGGEVRGQRLDEPIMTVDGSNRYGLVTSFLQQYYDGGYKGAGQSLEKPLPTITAIDHNSICAAHLIQMNNHCDGRDIKEPIPTITAGDGHFGEVRAFLIKYYGDATGQDIKSPLDTVTTKDRFGLVTIQGIDYQIVDIGLRMLEPKELYGCQGFPDDYIIDHDYTGKEYPRSEQVKRCGNAVCPPIPAALVRANLPELCKAKRQPICRPDRLTADGNGQLRFV